MLLFVVAYLGEFQLLCAFSLPQHHASNRTVECLRRSARDKGRGRSCGWPPQRSRTLLFTRTFPQCWRRRCRQRLRFPSRAVSDAQTIPSETSPSPACVPWPICETSTSPTKGPLEEKGLMVSFSTLTLRHLALVDGKYRSVSLLLTARSNSLALCAPSMHCLIAICSLIWTFE